MRIVVLALVLAACDAASGLGPDAPARDAAMPLVDATTGPDAPATLDAPIGCPVSGIEDATYGLANGAFPTDGHPDAAVHVPDGFDPCRPHGLVVWFHGFRNCVANVLGDVPTECTAGAGTRTAFSLSDQMDAAGVNAILVAVETRYDEASGDPGALAEDGRLHALLAELYAQLSPRLGRPVSVDDVSHVILASHSGGYVAVARSLELGGARVDEIELFDSLYGEIAVYQGWLEDDLASFDTDAAMPRRFAMVYTDGGGTDAQSRALAVRLANDLAASGDPANLLYDDTTATLDEASFRVPILVKHSALGHDAVVTYYFERFLRGSDLPRLP